MKHFAIAIVLAAITVIAQSAAAKELFAGRRLALVIGVNSFDDERWAPLHFAEKDAADVARALGKSFDRVSLLTGADRPTQARVLAALDELDRASTSDRDTIVVYISTHGTLAHDTRGALHQVLVLADTTEERALESGLAHEQLIERLDRLRSKRKLAVIASCHSGTGKSQLSPELLRDLKSLKGAFFAEPPVSQGEGRIVLAASAWGETASESDQLENDVYTHFFLQALEGFDLDQDGATTALEAHEYARRRTIEFTRGRQRPSMNAELVGEDPIVLAGERRGAGHPLVTSFAAAFAGATLEIDGREKGALPGSYAIEPGDRKVRVIREGQVMFERSVDVEPGDLLVLDRFLREELQPRLYLRAGLSLRAIRSREISARYFPSRPGPVIFASWGEAEDALRFGVELGGSRLSHDVVLNDPLSGDYITPVTLTLLDTALAADWIALRHQAFTFELTGRLGATVGRRDFAINTVAERTQTVSYPYLGAGLGVSWALNKTFGLRLSANADLSLPMIEKELRPIFSDNYQLGVWVRL